MNRVSFRCSGLLAAVFSCLLMSSAVRAQESIQLVWAPSPDPDVTQYAIYYGESGGTCTNLLQVGNATNSILTGLSSGKTYFVYATALNSAGSESDPSNVINYSVKSGPVLASVPDQVIPEGTMFTLPLTATDPDPTIRLVFTLVNGPSGATVDPVTGVFRWIPSEAQGPSNNSVTVEVSENGSTIWNDTVSFNLVVQEVNQAPVIAPIPDQTIAELSTLTVQVNAVDSDLPANTLTYSLVSGPAGAAINSTSGLLSWTPTEAQGPSSNIFVIQATDNGSPVMSAQVTFKVTVTEVNSAPVLAAIAAKTIPELTRISFNLSATDPDIPANTITYSLVSGPAGAAVDSVSGLFTWTPTEAQGPSSNVITVRATDNGSPALSDTKSFTITVSEVNSAPVLNLIPDQKVNPGQILMLQLSAVDTDLPVNKLNYRLKSGLQGANVDAATGVLTWRLAKSQAPGNYLVTVSVYDDGTPQLADTKTFTVTVNPKNTKNSQPMALVAQPYTLTWVAELEPSRLITFQQALKEDETTAPGTYYLEFSTDLKGWTRLGELPDAAEVRVASASDTTLRFYRVVSTGTGAPLDTPILNSVSFDP